MTTDLYSLVYVSSAKPLLDDASLADICDLARRENSIHDITGVLAYCDGNIVQYLEGPEKQVEQLFYNIEHDNRHKVVGKLVDDEITERLFPDWSMAFRHNDRQIFDPLEAEWDFWTARHHVNSLSNKAALLVFLKSCLQTMLLRS